MEDVEGSWDRQLTGREVGVWCVDFIEEINQNPGGELTERAHAVLARLMSLGEYETTFKLMAQAAVLVSRELQFYLDVDDMLPIRATGEEKYKRSLLAARAAFRGDTRLPTTPSDES